MYTSIALNIILALICSHLYNQNKLDIYTRLLNKYRFHQDVNRMNRANDVVILIDIDGFKHINDTAGHEYGDAVIVNVSNVIKRNIRASDRAYRVGGDEFAIITNSLAVLDRIHFPVSVSIGHGKTYAEADEAMYRNKLYK